MIIELCTDELKYQKEVLASCQKRIKTAKGEKTIAQLQKAIDYAKAYIEKYDTK